MIKALAKLALAAMRALGLGGDPEAEQRRKDDQALGAMRERDKHRRAADAARDAMGGVEPDRSGDLADGLQSGDRRFGRK